MRMGNYFGRNAMGNCCISYLSHITNHHKFRGVKQLFSQFLWVVGPHSVATRVLAGLHFHLEVGLLKNLLYSDCWQNFFVAIGLWAKAFCWLWTGDCPHLLEALRVLEATCSSLPFALFQSSPLPH